jgi:transcriptional regulator with XRE-family HTH domain
MRKGGNGPKSGQLQPDTKGARPHSHALWRHIGLRLRLRRTQLGFTSETTAKKVGISSEIYELYESGKQQTPALLLSDIAQLFHVPVTWFFQDLSFDEGTEADRVAEESVFTVATDDERVHALTEYFRNLDLEDQQHLLLVARTLYRTSKGPQRPKG